MTVDDSLNAIASALQSATLHFKSISDNIANVETIGYKRSYVNYSGVNTNNNFGVTSPPVWTGPKTNVSYSYRGHGAIKHTHRNLDLALNGRGFFITNTTLDQTGPFLLTDSGALERRAIPRAGAVNEGGQITAYDTYLVDSQGNFLMGAPYLPDTQTYKPINLINDLEPINIRRYQPFVDPATATTQVALRTNVPYVNDAGTTFTFQHFLYDGVGTVDGDPGNYSAQLRFIRQPAFNTWRVEMHPAPDPNARANFAHRPEDNLELVFNAEGGIQSLTRNGVPLENNSATFNGLQSTGSGPLNVNYDFSAVTSVSSTSGNTSLADAGTTVNGNPYRTVQYQALEVDADGVIHARFTHNIRQPVARIYVGDVRNEQGLRLRSGPVLEPSELSGPILLNDLSTGITPVPNANLQVGRRASIISNALETSTVSIVEEFAQMIIAQRAYSAAASALSTVSEIISGNIEIKR